jgi:hypothetical protein
MIVNVNQDLSNLKMRPSLAASSERNTFKGKSHEIRPIQG